MPTHEELVSQISAMKFPAGGKYSQKLDFDQRCEVLALYRTGVSRAALAEAYGIDRRTVTHIYNPRSPHYRAVRKEEEKLGKDAFQRKYITENGLNKLKLIYDAMAPEVDPKMVPKRGAGKYAGVHMIENENTNRPHRVQISWREKGLDGVPAGWYYRDADGAAPNEWLHNGDESRLTSQKCLAGAKESIFDL